MRAPLLVFHLLSAALLYILLQDKYLIIIGSRCWYDGNEIRSEITVQFRSCWLQIHEKKCDGPNTLMTVPGGPLNNGSSTGRIQQSHGSWRRPCVGSGPRKTIHFLLAAVFHTPHYASISSFPGFGPRVGTGIGAVSS